MKIVITGAAGAIGTALRPLLRERGHTLTCLDRVAPDTRDDDTWFVADITDSSALGKAFAGADLVLHFAGLSREHTWERIVEVNINGTQAVCEAAHAAGVPRLLLASSVHAAGFVPTAEAASAVASVRPDTYYGVGKVLAEALGSLYADRFDMTVVSARIMTFGDRPTTSRALATWLSPADMARLVEAAATTTARGHHIVWGVSDNTRGIVSLDSGHSIGFHPQDDAEVFADQVTRNDDSPLLGGVFTEDAHPIGVPWS